MKLLNFSTVIILLCGCKRDKSSNISSEATISTISQDLILIDQDYNHALNIASKEDR